MRFVLLVGFSFLLAACNCGGDGLTDGGVAAADAGAVDDAGLLDAGVATDAGSLDAGMLSDAGAGDAGTPDAGAVDAGIVFNPGQFFSFRLAYRPQADGMFVPPPFAELCIRRFNDTSWTPVYGAPGVGVGEVGRQHRVNRGNYTLKIVDVTQGCDSGGVFQTSEVVGNDSDFKRVTIAYVEGRISGVRARTTFSRFDSSILGRQDWVTVFADSAGANVTFQTDGGATVRLDSSPSRIDAGIVGTVAFEAFAIPYKAGSGTSTSVFVNAAMPLVAPLFCDDFVSAGHLTVCSSNLRAP